MTALVTLCIGNIANATDNSAPATTVTTPADGSVLRSGTVPSKFTGTVADTGGGAVGVNANSTTFTLQRSSDNKYWTGSAWQTSAFNLATTHAATSGTTSVNWTNSATLPTWSSQVEGSYTILPTGTDKNSNTGAGTAAAFTLDNTAPTVSSINRAGGNPANASSVSFTVTFSENVTGVDASDFSLTTSGVSGASVGTVSGSGSSYTVTVNTGTGDGSIRLDLKSSGTGIADTAGNGITTGFTSGQSYTIDKTAPTVTISAPSSSITASASVAYTVTYADANFNSSTLAAGNITLNKTGTANATIAVSGAGTTRTVTLSSITGDGTLGISIAAGTATDTAGNSAPAAGPSTTFTVDNTAPSVTIGSPSASVTASGPVTYTVTYSDANFNSSTLSAGNITLNKTGTANATVAVSGTGTTRTVTLSSITGDGTLGISVAASTATDLAGNSAPAAGPSATFTVDNTAPTVSSINRATASPTNLTSIQFTVIFSESVTGVDSTDFALVTTGVSGASITGVSGDGCFMQSRCRSQFSDALDSAGWLFVANCRLPFAFLRKATRNPQPTIHNWHSLFISNFSNYKPSAVCSVRCSAAHPSKQLACRFSSPRNRPRTDPGQKCPATVRKGCGLPVGYCHIAN